MPTQRFPHDGFHRTIDFVDQYRTSLSNLADRIKITDSDYIISVTRSGPRLLELMSYSGLFTSDVPVLTEKSIDYMSDDSLEGEELVVFDDVTNTGNTLSKLLLELGYKYGVDRGRSTDSNITPYTFAYDREEAKVDPEDVNPELRISTSKRYEIIKKITQSFSFLNKPYDVDHPIFYSNEGSEVGLELRGSDNIHDLTTIHQSNQGFQRYSIFPFKDSDVPAILPRILESNKSAEFGKVRVYYDSQTGEVASVPITSFSMEPTELRDDLIFSSAVPEPYNDLVDLAKRNIEVDDDSDRLMAIYRLVWYLTNYLYGVASHVHLDQELFEMGSPTRFLSKPDLVYLFGPKIADDILRSLDDTFESTVRSLQRLLDGSNHSPNTSWEHSVQSTQDSPLDPPQAEIYYRVLPYLRENAKREMTYSDKLSSIFEGIQLSIESEDEDEGRGKRFGEDNPPGLPVRVERKTALTFAQLVHLLRDADVLDDTEDEVIGLSLAVDFLVDTGVVIPTFYQNIPSESGHRNTPEFQRGFRHGEGALNRMGYNYLVDSVVDSLFDYTDGPLPKIVLEKIGVMITDRFDNGRFWGEARTSSIYDFLQGRKQNIDVSPKYYRYGRVVLQVDKTDTTRGFFTDWCEVFDIVEETDDGVVRGSGWKHKHENDITHVESTIEGREQAELEVLARLLYDVDERVDPSSGQDYLIALTTCRNVESFVNALRAELMLFFSNSNWRISPSIDLAKTIVDDYASKDIDRFADWDFGELSGKFQTAIDESSDAYQAINDIARKKRLRRQLKRSDIVSDVRDYFETHPDDQYRKNYEQNLEPYLDNLAEVSKHPSPEEEVLANKTTVFSDLCLAYSEAYRSILDILKQRVQGKTDLREEFSELYTHVSEFNDIIEENADMTYSGIGLDYVSRIELDDVRIDSVRRAEFVEDDLRPDESVILLIKDVLSEVVRKYRRLEEIYDIYFEDEHWARTTEDLFRGGGIRANWVVWYDIRDSSDPKNEERTDQLKDRIESRIQDLSGTIGDGLFEESDDDEKHVFVKDRSNVVRYVRLILEQATLQGMNVRVSVANVPSGKVNLKTKNKIKTTSAHVRACSIGEILNKKGVESDEHNYLSVPHGSLTELWGSKDLPTDITSVWNVSDTFDNTIDPKDTDVAIPTRTFELSKK